MPILSFLYFKNFICKKLIYNNLQTKNYVHLRRLKSSVQIFLSWNYRLRALLYDDFPDAFLHCILRRLCTR